MSKECVDCEHWVFSYHRTDKNHDIVATVGMCCIRSVPEDCFPERLDEEHCGEFTDSTPCEIPYYEE